MSSRRQTVSGDEAPHREGQVSDQRPSTQISGPRCSFGKRIHDGNGGLRMVCTYHHFTSHTAQIPTRCSLRVLFFLSAAPWPCFVWRAHLDTDKDNCAHRAKTTILPAMTLPKGAPHHCARALVLFCIPRGRLACNSTPSFRTISLHISRIFDSISPSRLAIMFAIVLLSPHCGMMPKTSTPVLAMACRNVFTDLMRRTP